MLKNHASVRLQLYSLSRRNYSYFLKNFLQLTFVLKLTIDFEHFFACNKKDEEKEAQPSDTISVAKKRKQPAADDKTKEKNEKEEGTGTGTHHIMFLY